MDRAAAAAPRPFTSGNSRGFWALDPCKMDGNDCESGDECCNAILMESGRRVGDVLAKLINFLNPSLIVIGGGVALVGERYIASIREAVYRRSTPLATSDLAVKKSILGEDGGVIGAAVLVLDEIFSHRNLSKLVGRGGQQARPDAAVAQSAPQSRRITQSRTPSRT